MQIPGILFGLIFPLAAVAAENTINQFNQAFQQTKTATYNTVVKVKIISSGDHENYCLAIKRKNKNTMARQYYEDHRQSARDVVSVLHQTNVKVSDLEQAGGELLYRVSQQNEELGQMIDQVNTCRKNIGLMPVAAARDWFLNAERDKAAAYKQAHAAFKDDYRRFSNGAEEISTNGFFDSLCNSEGGGSAKISEVNGSTKQVMTGLYKVRTAGQALGRFAHQQSREIEKLKRVHGECMARQDEKRAEEERARAEAEARRERIKEQHYERQADRILDKEGRHVTPAELRERDERAREGWKKIKKQTKNWWERAKQPPKGYSSWQEFHKKRREEQWQNSGR